MDLDDRSPLSSPVQPGSLNFGFETPYDRTDEMKQNPLSKFSSYNYNITFYITSAEGITEFIETGKFGENDDYYIVAQSGGLGSSEKRALTNNSIPGPNQGYDYYIEDLEIEMYMPGAQKTSTIGTAISFKIVEPYGFTFFKRLKDLNGYINGNSNIARNSDNKALIWQQHYIIGIRFYGYDKDGNLAKATDISANVQNNNLSNEYGSFERYFPIVINQFSHKLDGRATTYSVTGNILNLQTAFGSKRGFVTKDSTIIAGTVGEALQNTNSRATSSKGLMQILNEDQKDQQSKGILEYPTQYEIEWEPDSDIPKSLLVSIADYDPRQAAPSNAVRTTTDGTVAASASAQTIDTNRIKIPIAQGTPIISVIDNIITKSAYVRDKLIAVNNAALETRAGEKQTRADLNWFTINPKVIPVKRDTKTQDWVYKIVYQIQKYYVPYSRALWKANSVAYYGPHKIYQFWLTGKNTEIIGFEQTFDNQYYQIRTSSINNTDINPVQTVGSTVPVHLQGGAVDPNLTQGKLQRGSGKESEIRASIVSIADQAKATIKIFGDPDYLMQNVGNSPSFGSDLFNKFYGRDGYSINPTGGQVFIEIVFNIAEDYQNNGILDVSDQIAFYDEKEIRQAGIKGVIYRVIKVNSSFSKGLFSQTLDLLYVPVSLLRVPQNRTLGAGGVGGDGDGEGTGTGGLGESGTGGDENNPTVNNDGSRVNQTNQETGRPALILSNPTVQPVNIGTQRPIGSGSASDDENAGSRVPLIDSADEVRD